MIGDRSLPNLLLDVGDGLCKRLEQIKIGLDGEICDEDDWILPRISHRPSFVHPCPKNGALLSFPTPPTCVAGSTYIHIDGPSRTLVKIRRKSK